MDEQQSLPNFSNKKRRADWLASLPLAHQHELEKTLSRTLQALNQAVIPPHQRFISLETIAEPLANILESVKQQILSSHFPSSEKYKHHMRDICTLLQYFAEGYLKTIESLSAHGHDDKNGTFFTLAIFRAMQVHFTLQYIAYTNYRTPNSLTWANLHKLYDLALSKRIHFEKVIENPVDLVKAEHIESLYKQALLLSLASPFQLSNNFTAKLTPTLVYWAQYCNMYDITETTSDKGLFVVRPNYNTPPRPVKECDVNACHGYFFDSTKLLNRVKQIASRPGIQLLPENVRNLINTTPLSNIKRVYRSWGKFSKRVFARRNTKKTLQLTLGFKHIYQALEQRQQKAKNDAVSSQPQSKPAQFDSYNIPNVGWDNVFQEVFELDSPNDHILNNSIPHKLLRGVAPHYLEEKTDSTTIPKLELKVVDESAGGFCLSLPLKSNQTIAIGDLVAVEFADKQSNAFTLCIVRWMKETNQALLFGIEAISPFAEAITLTEISKRNSEPMNTPGLLLPQIPSLNVEPSLVIPRSANLKASHEYLLRTSTEEVVITLTKTIDSTGLYIQSKYDATLGVNTLQDSTKPLFDF